MDPEPEPSVLIRHRLPGLVLLLAACGGGEAPAPPPLPALAGPVSLLRLPRAGGQVTAYHPADLSEAGWTSTGRLGPLRGPLGADLDERLIFAIDEAGSVVAVDLETRAVRSAVLSGATSGIMAGDGSIYVVDSDRRVTHLLRRSPTRYRSPLPAAPRFLFGGLNDRLIAVTGGDAPEVVFLTPEAPAVQLAAPPGEAAATLWGDLIAIAADSAVVLFDGHSRERQPSLRAGDGLRVVAFSPSGHRLYVGRSRGDLLVVDRFNREVLATIPLSGPVAAIRPDMTGRWLLLRAAGSDSVWVVDATANRVAARFATSWDEDLPMVAGPAHLTLRSGAAVETWDLTHAEPTRTGRVAEGAQDFWTAIAWVPPDQAQAAQAAVAQASGEQDSALVFGTIPLPSLAPPAQVYLQISSSQNPSWARELARQLVSAGYPALVRDPTATEEGYRVVLGPYSNREVAEQAGRQLGRPYFVLTEPLSSIPR